MSELEKKFSDFQKNECDTIVVTQPIDERLCPECFPNPNFSLPDKWYLIKESYLNEEFCEYHYRVYQKTGEDKLSDERKIEIAIERMIVDFDKALNNESREALRRVTKIIKRDKDENMSLTGCAVLVAVPAFNFDRLPDLEDEDGEQDEQDDSDPTPPPEAIVNYKDMFKKTMQLRSALRVYSFFYASAQHLKDVGLQVVYKNNPSKRVNYKALRKNIKNFTQRLNIFLRQNNFQGIDYPSLIRRRWETIKFIYKKDQPFVLEAIYVLDENCLDKYTKLSIPPSDDLFQPGFESTNYFFANFTKVISDITAQQTKPWLEFSLDHIYPPTVVNYGDLESFSEDDYIEMGCLLEKSLGIGNGQVVDYLGKQILSFFKTLENDLYKSACRSINQLSEEGTEASNANRKKSAYEERKQRTEATYIRQFLDDAHSELIEKAKKYYPEEERESINKNNVFQKLKSNFVAQVVINPRSYDYKNDEGERLPSPHQTMIVQNQLQLEQFSVIYAETKFELLNNSWGDQFKNNADWEEMKESYSEAFNSENTFLDYVLGKNAAPDDKPPQTDSAVLNTIGLCGISKLTGEALKCLLGGVTIEDFYDILIEKTLQYMDTNVFSLFLNGLPLSFRQDLDRAIEEQFGGVSITTLINMKTQSPSKINDIVAFGASDRIVKIFERSPDPLADAALTPDDRAFIENNIGDEQFYTVVKAAFGIYYDRNADSLGYREDLFPIELVKPSTIGSVDADGQSKEEKKEYKKAKKYVKKVVKHAKKSYLAGSDTYAQANKKLKKTVDLFGQQQRGDSKEAYNRSLKSLERADKKLNQTNMGTKIDVVYDVVFDFAFEYILDSLNVDFLIEQASNYPGVDLALGFATDFFKSCPHPPLIHPPAGDFMKTFSLDVCDPEASLTLPKINFPSLSLRYNLEKQFAEVFRNAIIQLITKIAINLLKKVLGFLEDALCKTIGAVGGFVADGIQNGNLISGAIDNFENMLDQLFCGGSTNPNTGNKRASELANGLFRPALAQSGADYEGAGRKVSNIISSVLSQDEMLGAVVNGDDRANKMISNAIDALAPEMKVLLGTPDQVAVFFENLRSYLPDEEQQRIRDLLDAGIPNLPLTASVCLTNDQLKAWNDLRNKLLRDAMANEGVFGSGGQTNASGGYGDGSYPSDIERAVDNLNSEVEDALEGVLDDAFNLEDSDGPFLGALTDEVMKDVCNPKNLVNDVSDSDLGKAESSEFNKQYFQLLMRIMMISFNGRNGIFGNALRDKENKREGIFRNFAKFVNPNYGNAQTERSAKYLTKGIVGTAIMNALTEGDDENGLVIGDYPETVGLYLKDQMSGSLTFNLPTGFSMVYEENPGLDAHYKARHRFINLGKPDSFSYDFAFVERLEAAQLINDNYTLAIPEEISEEELLFMESLGIQPKSDIGNLRQDIFTAHVSSLIPIQKDYGPLYQKVFESLMTKAVDATVSRPITEDNPLGLSYGFLFGYVDDDIVPDVDFEYLNPDSTDPYSYDESEGVLGYYNHDRIKVLNPEIYGGRYSNPPYTILPRKFVGWIEYATKGFQSQDGCDPKRPPMLSLLDIEKRVEFLEQNLRNYSELSKSKECMIEPPFKLLINNKTRARMDGVVRSTLRIYIAESFLKGIGVFANVHYREENFDSSLPAFITYKIKQEMLEIGPTFLIGRKVIAYERYWYTFLEQAVQSYQTMYDLKEVSPPLEVLEALEEISLCQMAYSNIDRSVKKRMKKLVEDLKNRPLLENRETLLTRPAALGIYAMDFRLASNEDRDNYFGSGPIDDRVDKNLIKFSSVKKLRFFAKIFAIRMYEKEAVIILRELIRVEAARLSESAFEGLNDKPYVYDINKAFIGLPNIFPNSSSKIGFNSYYLQKQLGTAMAGDVPDVKEDITSPPSPATEDVQFVVEKYVRIKSKDGTSLPLEDGVHSLEAFKGLIAQLSSENPSNNLSDYFGNLKFTYFGSFKQLMDKGFANQESINKLNTLNLNSPTGLDQLESSLRAYITELGWSDDFNVIFDDSFLLEEEEATPSGTTGKLDIDYGLRISCVLPVDTFTEGEIALLQQNSQVLEYSEREKTLVYEDGTVVIPLVSTEVPALDAKLVDYLSGQNYDLECLVNKLVETPEFSVMFGKVLPIKMATSAAAIFCSENFMKSIGKAVDEEGLPLERSEDAFAALEAGEDADEWEGVMNEFLKNFLRREFQSAYFSNDVDGFSFEGLSGRERLRLFGSFNPFDIFSLPAIRIPWFRKRRLKLRVYDANGNECADPVKDFQ